MEVKEYIRTINSFKLLLSALFLAIFMVPILFIIFIFFIHRTFVFVILKLKFRSKFGGIMKGLDPVFPSFSENIINVILIAKTNNSFEEFHNKFKEVVNRRIFQNPQNDPKLLSTHHKLYGYHYIVQNQVEIDKCVRRIKLNWKNEEISKNELMKAISNTYCNQTLPYNNTNFWEILLCENSIKWDDKIDKTERSFVILCRFHHSLAEGTTIMKFISNTFSDSYDKIEIETSSQNKLFRSFKVKILDFIYILLMTPIVLLSQILSHKNVSSFSNQHIMVVKTEESRKCIQIIKSIKRKVQGARFEDILAVAISKSYSTYFQKKGKHPNISCLNAYMTMLVDYPPNYIKFSKSKTIKLQNLFAMANINIPIIHSTDAASSYLESSIATLKKLKMENKYCNVWFHAKVLYEVIKVITYFFPEYIFLRLMYYNNTPLLISNVPGPPKMTLFDGCYIETLFFWVPRPAEFGSTFGFLSYDERLQIALNVDKEIISDERDAQDIVDGIYQALIRMDDSV